MVGTGSLGCLVIEQPAVNVVTHYCCNFKALLAMCSCRPSPHMRACRCSKRLAALSAALHWLSLALAAPARPRTPIGLPAYIELEISVGHHYELQDYAHEVIARSGPVSDTAGGTALHSTTRGSGVHGDRHMMICTYKEYTVGTLKALHAVLNTLCHGAGAFLLASATPLERPKRRTS